MADVAKVNSIANGKVKCSKFRLQKGKLWYTAAYKDDTKDRKRVRVTRIENGVEVRRYLDPHTLVVLEGYKNGNV